MVIEFLQLSVAETITTNLIAQATLNIHPDSTYAVFFIGVSAANVASNRSLIGILHKYNSSTVSVMKEADLMNQNERKYRFQLGRLKLPSIGNNVYEVQFDYTGAKTILFAALSYKGIDLSGSGMEAVAAETNPDDPTDLSIISTASGNLIVDGVLFREIMPGGDPTESGGQTSRGQVFTIDNHDWGIEISEKSTTASGSVSMSWDDFTNNHIHLMGSLVEA